MERHIEDHSTDSSSDEIRIITLYDKQEYKVFCPRTSNATVKSLKNQIHELLGIPVWTMRLVYPAHELKDDQLLTDLNLKRNSTIFMILRDRHSIKTARFVVMAMNGSRCFIEMPIVSKVKRVVELISLKFNLQKETFLLWTRERKAISAAMEELTISEAFGITATKQQQRDEFLVVRDQRKPPTTEKQVSQLFRQWSKFYKSKSLTKKAAK